LLALSRSQKDFLQEATSTYHANVEMAHDYLAKRGLSAATADMYRLGVVAQTHAALGDEDYVGRLTIPYITASGDVVALRYRTMTGQEPKYLSAAGTQTHLFSVTSLLADSDTVVVTEGEIDAMTLNQIGIPAVGVPGARAFKPHFPLLFEDFDRVLIACDGDQAGREFGRLVSDQIHGAIAVHMPEGQDVNSVYVSSGEDELKSLLRMGQ